MANTRTQQVTLPPSQSYDTAARKRAIAEALATQAQAPREVIAGPTAGYVANGLTQLGQALLARRAGKKADAAEIGADSQMRDTNRAAIEKLAGAYQFEGLDDMPATQIAGGSLPGSQIETALSGMDPRAANQVVAKALLEKAMPVQLDPDKAAQRELTREQIAATREQQKLALEQRAAEAEMRASNAALDRDARAQAARDAADLRRQLKDMDVQTARYIADSRRAAADATRQQKADLSAAEAQQKDQAIQDFMANTAANVTDEIDKALKIVDSEMGTTGFVGGLASKVGGTDARTLKGHLDTIKSNLGFDRLQQMRDMSKTGGALGNIAVKELEMLQSTIASFDQAQDKKPLRENLEKAKKHYSRWKQAFEGTLKDFDSEADADQAASSGLLKPGDKVTIGGVSGTWQ